MAISHADLRNARAGASHAEIDRIQKTANDRKRDVYWIGFLQGALSSHRIETGEDKAMLARFHDSMILSGSVVFRDLWRALEAALADKVLTEDESNDIREWIALLVGDGHADTGMPNIGNVAQLERPITDPAEPEFEGRCFVLTGPMRMGPMRMGPRSVIVQDIERCGGTVSATTNRKTRYVVMSATASGNWRTSHFGTKIERAKQPIAQGYQLRFVPELALAQAIGLQPA